MAAGAAGMLSLTACSDDKANIDYPVHVLVPEEGHKGYELVWADEFDTDGLPNDANWGYEEGYRRNEELQDYKKADETTACVKEGKLVLTAYHDPHEGVNPWTQEPYHFEFSSASVITKDKVDFERGRIDILARIPRGQGVWPAFWLRPSTNKYPKAYSEIDIMEYVWDWDEAHSRFHATLHTQEGLDGLIEKPSGVMSSPTLDTKFHQYSLVWGYKNIQVLFDNKVVLSFDRTKNSAKHWPFDQPHFLLMNIAVGGGWGGQWGIDNEAFPLSMEVDYVRYYKLIDEEQKPFFPVNNYIENGNFETEYKAGEEPVIETRSLTDKDKILGFENRWFALKDDKNAPNAQLTVDSSTGAEGSSHSLKYSADKVASWYHTDLTFPFRGVKPGTYNVSFWVKTNKTESPFTMILGYCETEEEVKTLQYKNWHFLYLQDGQTLQGKESKEAFSLIIDTATPEWIKYQATVDIPENVMLKFVFKPNTKVSPGQNNYAPAADKANIEYWFDQFDLSEAQD